MEELKYKIAYSEVMEILAHIPKNDYEKIPIEYINFLENEKDKNYCFVYDVNKTLDEQNVSKEAKTIIAILFRDYWATPHQKEIILKNEKIYRDKIEENKKKKYNTEISFNNITNKKSLNNPKTEIKIISKERWYNKIINKIRKIIKNLGENNGQNKGRI